MEQCSFLPMDPTIGGIIYFAIVTVVFVLLFWPEKQKKKEGAES
jgi:hypothetical protein